VTTNQIYNIYLLYTECAAVTYIGNLGAPRKLFASVTQINIALHRV